MTSRSWDLYWHYEVRTLASLPPVRKDLAETGYPCMARPAWLRRVRWRAARRTSSDCCYHHGIDWHAVNKVAIPIARRAEADGAHPEDLVETIDPESCGGLTGDELDALRGLFIPGDGIEINDDDPRHRELYEGNHRVTAMRDAGVRRTVVLRSELIEMEDKPSWS